MEFKSDSYGTYTLTKVAKIYFYPIFDPKETEEERLKKLCIVSTWADRYHPRTFFGSYMIETTRPDLPKHAPIGEECQELYPYYLYVPLRANNTDWYENNIDSSCVQNFKRLKCTSKILPISVTDRMLKLWIKKSKEAGIVIKTY